jgi:two-component sensor histidine kinase
VAALERLARERTDLDDSDIEHLATLTAEWSLLSDLAVADLVLWLPTWHGGGFVAAAQVRPTTGTTAVADDVVNTYAPRGRRLDLERAFTEGAIVPKRAATDPEHRPDVEAIPIRRTGRVIAVLARHNGSQSRGGLLEQVYHRVSDALIDMVADGSYPAPARDADASSVPRVGDGLLVLDNDGVVEFASPNAMSAFRRLGLSGDLIGRELSRTAIALEHRPGQVDETLGLVASGKVDATTEVENTAATVSMRSVRLRPHGRPAGTLILVQDVTDLRRRERALLGKDAALREVHHRVKNNLQTVAALLRLQRRRVVSPEAVLALAEAEQRIAAIAVVHDSLAHTGDDELDFDEVANRVVTLVREMSPALTGGNTEVVIDVTGHFGVVPEELATPLATVLAELVQNAVEHGAAPQGGHVVVAATRTATALTVSVTDDGPGLPDDLDSAASGRLGLSIVRTLVGDQMGGTLTMEAASPTGAVATVRVPIAPA